MPSPKVMTAASVNPGDRLSRRAACRIPRPIASHRIRPPPADQYTLPAFRLHFARRLWSGASRGRTALPNYPATHRKRSGLSQSEAARIVEAEYPDVISRIERVKNGWRRDGDSNPRYPFGYTRFPSVRLRPLGHLSASAALLV